MAGGGGGLGDGFWLSVNLQLISERVLSALACLLVERMVCLTAERGWNKEAEISRWGKRFWQCEQPWTRVLWSVIKLLNTDAALPRVICHLSPETWKQNWELLFLHWAFASSHYYAHQMLFVCNKLHCLQSIAFRVFSFIVANTVPLLSGGRKAQWSFKKPLVPPLWLPHRCDVDSSWNNNVDGENQEEGEGRWKCTSAVLIFTVSVSVCMTVYKIW